jgi:hypothetical protein
MFDDHQRAIDSFSTLQIMITKTLLSPLVTCPQTPQETQRWVPKRNNGRKKELGHTP